MNRLMLVGHIVRSVLLAVLLGANLTLLRFTFRGPFRLVLPVQSPVNAESIIGLSFLLVVLFWNVKSPQPLAQIEYFSFRWIACLLIFANLPFLITLNAPLLHDSYAHIAEAAHETGLRTLQFFMHPSSNDLFFRPLGYLTYWLDFHWARYDPVRWHLWNLIVHAANACLVYVLATKLSLTRFGAATAALVFACHGSRPEVVCWAAARFDLLAACFVLLGLAVFNEYLETRRLRWYVATGVFAVLGVLSKESAYCFPFLAAGFAVFKDRRITGAVLRRCVVLIALCGAVFMYRFWLIGSIGGYRTAAGTATVLQFNLVHSVKSLFFRQWAFLFFPINWASDVNPWVRCSLVLMLAVMLGFLIWSNANRYLVVAAISMEVIAALPVHHLLLMTADLAGARVLYLPVLGLALFWGVLVQGCQRPVIRVLLAGGLLSFQFIALCHNLETWRKVAFLSQKTCRDLGAELARDPRPIIVRGLPAKWNGVFFLRNGFPQCVAVNSRERADRIYIENEGPPPSGPARVFSWSDKKERLQEVTPDRGT